MTAAMTNPPRTRQTVIADVAREAVAGEERLAFLQHRTGSARNVRGTKPPNVAAPTRDEEDEERDAEESRRAGVIGASGVIMASFLRRQEPSDVQRRSP